MERYFQVPAARIRARFSQGTQRSGGDFKFYGHQSHSSVRYRSDLGTAAAPAGYDVVGADKHSRRLRTDQKHASATAVRLLSGAIHLSLLRYSATRNRARAEL